MLRKSRKTFGKIEEVVLLPLHPNKKPQNKICNQKMRVMRNGVEQASYQTSVFS
jgi:hypothetical protein